MIAYLDSSALVKRYVSERGSETVANVAAEASFVGISVIGRAEVEAALVRAVRLGVISESGGSAAREAFAHEWDSFLRISATEAIVARAGSLAWAHGLRGYDSVHLASALTWRDGTGEQVSMVTFDKELMRAAAAERLDVTPTQTGVDPP